MKRVTGIIVAGMLTGTVLVTVLALGIRNFARANQTTDTPTVSEPAASDPIIIEQNIPVDSGAPSVGVQTGQQSQVDELLATMAEREAAYQAQLDAANQTIQQMQAQQQVQPAPSSPAYYDDDEHERGEYEHEGYEEHEDD